MKIFNENSIVNFKPWSGAVSTHERIINENKVNEFDDLIEELYPDGLSETQLNDILWFESDWVYENLNIELDPE